MIESRLDSLRMVDPVLTNLALGYQPSNYIGHKLFPTVKVKAQKGRVPFFGKDSFVVRDSERAIRSNSNRIPTMDFETIEFTLQERDLEVAMDYLEESETYDLLKYEQKLTLDLLNILTLEKEKAIADYVQNPDNFATDSKILFDPEVNFTNCSGQFSLSNLIDAATDKIRSNISKKPNTIIMGPSTYNQIITNSDLIMSLPNTNKIKIDYKLLQDFFEIENIIIGLGVSSNDGRIFEDIWGNNLLFAYVDSSDENRRSQYNPSYGYIFQKDGMPEIDTYYENGGKIKVIRATDNWTLKVVCPEAAFLVATTS
jgi:hypothetical protein